MSTTPDCSASFFPNGFANAGTIKLGGSIVVDYATQTLLPAVRDQILSGRHGGDWSGAGIASATPADLSKAIGYGEASVILGLSGAQTANWQGQLVDPTSILARYTLAGDTNLDGAVTFPDLVAVAQHYGLTDGSATWSMGDSNYDGNIDFADLVAVALNYGGALPASAIPGSSPDFQHDVAAPFASVPEPSAPTLSILSLAALTRRRRRKPSPASSSTPAHKFTSK